jgi:hypothetical protein
MLVAFLLFKICGDFVCTSVNNEVCIEVLKCLALATFFRQLFYRLVASLRSEVLSANDIYSPCTNYSWKQTNFLIFHRWWHTVTPSDTIWECINLIMHRVDLSTEVMHYDPGNCIKTISRGVLVPCVLSWTFFGEPPKKILSSLVKQFKIFIEFFNEKLPPFFTLFSFEMYLKNL